MTEENLSRRHFLRAKFFNTLKSETEKTQGLSAIRPPWSIDVADFLQGCNRCGDCIAICETKILVKGEGDYPEVRFSEGECTFCQKCVEICQQPIFRSVDETPWQHKIEMTSACLTQQQVECRSCQDSCEMRAIRFRPQLNTVVQPILDLANCNGCGACIKSCPVSAINIINPV
ncbi:ferredoxin-type protein role in electron transfer to periplasmic nitrate reductase (NapA) [Canicola haemoglobinophilus]|uniref:Ferredoxin-type protein NapF n=1 Tax=Canicola haemoglobinophilus TaxID=733 RepID=A0AB38H5U9_9PAST|nr:ferredoxin-type protein NapF [Canicola haemoglobinophilus]STO54530.1 ferredoxin-type protein role in electron transfer to periplasmic nitrate reductase (NapA) [Canicola haemoglobinophilus]STO67695.1 ferredoxin-type protein role in electron transfer to periplasmic nitrate reductase (NapA) [Canicola haemoglobinophilus]